MRLSALVALVLLALATPAQAASTRYVSATAPAGGDGSAAHPFSTLAAVAAAGAPGDRIVVQPSDRALDGGIELKAGQQLVSDGGRVANTTSAHNGDAITLADDTTVSGIQVTAARRGGIYGRDISGATVTGNDVTGTNTSCATGFVVQPFQLPTIAPGVGAPFATGLPNGWGSIMVDAAKGASKLTFTDNHVHDTGCADGIDVRASGTAKVSVNATGNVVEHIKQDVRMQSVLAIGMQARDTSTLTADLDHNRESYIGTGSLGDLGFADSEGLFANGSGRSHLTERADHNTFEHGLGHLSANCVESVGSNGGPTISFTLTNSTCIDVVGDVLENANLSAFGDLTFVVDHVIARHSTFPAAGAFSQAEPGDDGDCMIEIASGAGSRSAVTITNSILTDCIADGLGVVSNVVDGHGAVEAVRFDVRNSILNGSGLANLRIAAATAITALDGRIEHTNLTGAGTADVFLENINLAGGTNARLDLGGGPLGSPGFNCLAGGNLATIAGVGANLDARHAWWGQPGGPKPTQFVAAGPTVTSDQPLDSAGDCGPVPGTVLGPLPEASATPRACASRRVITIHLPRTWRRATATTNGRGTTVRRRAGRLTVRLDLRGRTTGTVTVRARGTTHAGRPVSQTRRFHPCPAR